MKKTTSLLILSLGLLLFSLELFLVKIIQALETVCGTFYDDIWYYFKMPSIFIPLLITLCVIIYSIYMLIKNHHEL